MSMNLVYTDVAIQDLKRLRTFIAVHNPQAAAQAAAKLIEKISLLRSFPYLGSPVTHAPEIGAVRDMVFDYYVVRYSVHSHTIIILKVWHSLEQRQE
ncbi:type II toxin-antitoxin system RelE/ParE family toxin [Pseudidiomarina sp. CB1]|uniref:type II toxin-antitoxin system RelE/ParE family toxin n=1 Tax=Pseudidiomarina sp. CB1 TaxID=2972484 RepID=UPI0021628C31|nr:type II toxin-antitoxin system RelE/ParE family toxin [Pseudidiomarina sp. CB1]